MDSLFDALDSTMATIMTQIEDGITKANKLSDKCAYKKDLLNALNKIKENMQNAKNGLEGTSTLNLYLYSDPNPNNSDAAKVTFPFWSIQFNTTSGLYNNFFDLTPDIQLARLLHEQTHLFSVGNTGDNASGVDFWDNGSFYEFLPNGQLNNWGMILLNEIKTKTGTKCCPDNPWPR